MKHLLSIMAVVMIVISCRKDHLILEQPADEFVKYHIAKGKHYSDRSSVSPISLSEMKFKVKFDETAIYTTIDPENQFDINKLFGFTEGIDPHVHSARIGWSFNNQKLRLYAYAYHNGVRLSEEITTVALYQQHECAIKISGNHYVFTVNGIDKRLPRFLNSSIAEGYQLYPYFGGDETAPADINIYIRQLPQTQM